MNKKFIGSNKIQLNNEYINIYKKFKKIPQIKLFSINIKNENQISESGAVIFEHFFY